MPPELPVVPPELPVVPPEPPAAGRGRWRRIGWMVAAVFIEHAGMLCCMPGAMLLRRAEYSARDRRYGRRTIAVWGRR